MKALYRSIWLLPVGLVVLVWLYIAGYLESIQNLIDRAPYVLDLGEMQVSLWGIASSLVLLLALMWPVMLVVRWMDWILQRSPIESEGVVSLLSKLFAIFVYAMFGMAVLSTAGIKLDSVALMMGGVGLGIGIGMQRIAANFVSGLLLLVENRNQIGDLIELPGIMGHIREVSLRFTLVEGFDGREVLVPNEDLITSQVVNWTLTNNRGRVAIEFSVAYGSDLERVMEIAMELASDHPASTPDPAPFCCVRTFADSGIDLLLLFYVNDVNDGRYGPQSDVMVNLHKRFDEEGIEIPFPQREVRVLK